MLIFTLGWTFFQKFIKENLNFNEFIFEWEIISLWFKTDDFENVSKELICKIAHFKMLKTTDLNKCKQTTDLNKCKKTADLKNESKHLIWKM